MIRLILYQEALLGTVTFGGLPVQTGNAPFIWPNCACCGKPMQHLAKLHEGSYLYQVFMCQNNPGLCDEWDADGGANAIVVTHNKNLSPVTPPSEGVSVREVEHGSNIAEFESQSYDEAYSQWMESDKSPRQVLGQLGGIPDWIQADETPNCSACGRTMTFMAQLEQGSDPQTEMNFGGGCAYIFKCSCGPEAKFLWQC